MARISSFNSSKFRINLLNICTFESVESLWRQLMPHNRQVRQQQKQSRRLESGDLSEGEFDLQQLFSMNIRNGTRLIEHELPLVGYLPDRIDYPFYRMTFPLKKALSKNHWATAVLGKRNAHINDVWHELFYYNFTKGYDKKEIDTFRSIFK